MFYNMESLKYICFFSKHPAILLSLLFKCPPNKHEFGTDASVFVCYSKDLLFDCFGLHTHMAGLVNPCTKQNTLVNSKEIGEAYPTAFECLVEKKRLAKIFDFHELMG